VEIVKRLVASGKVDVNAVNGRGDSALHKVRNVQEKFQVTREVHLIPSSRAINLDQADSFLGQNLIHLSSPLTP
jgi:hypothetical protein